MSPVAAEEYEVIVHAAGRLEQSEAHGYWTEVPALSACMGEGSAVEDALEDTRRAIEAWLLRTRGHIPPVRLTPDYAL